MLDPDRIVVERPPTRLSSTAMLPVDARQLKYVEDMRGQLPFTFEDGRQFWQFQPIENETQLTEIRNRCDQATYVKHLQLHKIAMAVSRLPLGMQMFRAGREAVKNEDQELTHRQYVECVQEAGRLNEAIVSFEGLQVFMRTRSTSAPRNRSAVLKSIHINPADRLPYLQVNGEASSKVAGAILPRMVYAATLWTPEKL